MKKDDCIFCKIVNKEIYSEIVFEDEHTIAFLDIHPKSPGHTLLIPKEHYQWFTDIPEDLNTILFRNARKLAQNLKEKYEADYVRLGIVGIDIPHAHIHLIPLNLRVTPSDIDII